MVFQLMQTEIAGSLDIHRNIQWQYGLGTKKNGPENYISDRYTKIAQQMFQVMMSKFATDKTRFERPSSVQELNGEIVLKRR